MPPHEFVKIAIPAQEDYRAMFRVSFEYLWARPLADGSYQLDNIPCYTLAACADDIVRADPCTDGSIESDIDGVPVFLFHSVLKKSGNITIHVMSCTKRDRTLKLEDDPSYQPFVSLFDAIRPSECIFEGADYGPFYLASINIPPTAVRTPLLNRLAQGELDKHWVYARSD